METNRRSTRGRTARVGPRGGAVYAPHAPRRVLARVWIKAVHAAGIAAGWGVEPPRYCPGDRVARAQMAGFLLRAKEGPAHTRPPATDLFADVLRPTRSRPESRAPTPTACGRSCWRAPSPWMCSPVPRCEGRISCWRSSKTPRTSPATCDRTGRADPSPTLLAQARSPYWKSHVLRRLAPGELAPGNHDTSGGHGSGEDLYHVWYVTEGREARPVSHKGCIGRIRTNHAFFLALHPTGRPNLTINAPLA